MSEGKVIAAMLRHRQQAQSLRVCLSGQRAVAQAFDDRLSTEAEAQSASQPGTTSSLAVTEWLSHTFPSQPLQLHLKGVVNIP